MTDNLNDIRKYYSQNSEVLRHEKQQMEFEITCRLFKRILKKNARILELGCGAGFYSFFFASLGHQVSAVDFTPELIQQAQQIKAQTSYQDQLEFLVMDARDLTAIKDKYDYVLSMGPLYHLINQDDRLSHLKSAFSVLNPGGEILAVYLTKMGFLNYLFSKSPQILNKDPRQIIEVMNQGYFEGHPRNGTFRGYFSDVQQAQEEIEKSGFHLQKSYILDPGVGAIDEIFNRLSDQEKELWADYYFQFIENRDLIGSGRTVMLRGVKP